MGVNQLGAQVLEYRHDVGAVGVECGAVGSHNAAKVVAHFWDWSALRGDKMKDKAAQHAETGGGQCQRKRVMRQHVDREGGKAPGCGFVCHTSKIGDKLSFIKGLLLSL